MTDRDLRGAIHVSKIVRNHLRHNGDWNINDWKDVADALSGFVLRLEPPTETATAVDSKGS